MFSSSFLFSSAQNVQNNRRMEFFKIFLCLTLSSPSSLRIRHNLFFPPYPSTPQPSIDTELNLRGGKERTNERTNKQQQKLHPTRAGKKERKNNLNLLHRHLTNHKGIKRTLNYCGVEAGCCLSLLSACMKS